MDGMTDRGNKTGGHGGRAYHKGHERLWQLSQRNVQDRRRRSCIQAVLLNIPHYSNDLTRGLRKERKSHMLANRVLITPQTFSHGLADENHCGLIRSVGIVEIASSFKRN